MRERVWLFVPSKMIIRKLLEKTMNNLFERNNEVENSRQFVKIILPNNQSSLVTKTPLMILF